MSDIDRSLDAAGLPTADDMRKFEEFKAGLTHPLTIAGFRAAWKDMSGKEPSQLAIDQWVQLVHRLAFRAGQSVTL
jgi:hypothetical protein